MPSFEFRKGYVADVTDPDELMELLAEADDRLPEDPLNEQAQWDREDILDRLEEITPRPKLARLFARPTPFNN